MTVHRLGAILVTAALAVRCGGDDATAPLEVIFGETTLVVIVNPVVNDQNGAVVPAPGTTRADVSITLDDGPSATTDANGVAVLRAVPAGTRTMTLEGGGNTGQVQLTIAEKDLQEVAIALTSTGAALMARVVYAFGGDVVEIAAGTPVPEVNTALTGSDLIVFVRGGTYAGDLEFRGNNVTLFGQGSLGGQVTLDGNVTVFGDGNRIRGARVTGDLDVPGLSAGMSFSRVVGALDLPATGAVLLHNAFCGANTITADDAALLGNAGLAPIPAPAGGC